MKSDEEVPVFPYEVIWEEFAPSAVVNWEYLEGDEDQYRLVFSIGRVRNRAIPIVNETVLRKLAEQALGRDPSKRLIAQLYLLAGWQVTGPFRKEGSIDLQSQRVAMRNLEIAAFGLWEASNRISAHVAVLLPMLHSVEPERLLAEGVELDVHEIGRAAYDISLVAGRAFRDTKPKTTGRRSEFRRDATVRLGTEAIEVETGEPIAISRGNAACATPHFTNAGGRLLRDLFKLLEPKTDEGLILQSLVRTRGAKRRVNKTRD